MRAYCLGLSVHRTVVNPDCVDNQNPDSLFVPGLGLQAEGFRGSRTCPIAHKSVHVSIGAKRITNNTIVVLAGGSPDYIFIV